MKTLGSTSTGVGHLNHLPKLRLNRTRTWSADSGCDVLADSPDLSSTIMEDAIHTWEIRLEGVVRQEVERAKEVTEWAKEALRHAGEDGNKKNEVLMNWQSQMDGIMEFTKDLVECVNNDTKEVMNDCMGLSSGHESTSTIEEMEEDGEEKEEEIMQLFLLSAMRGQNNGCKRGKSGTKNLMKEFLSIYKKHGKVFKSSRKASKEVHDAYAKIKRQESFTKRRSTDSEEFKFKDNYKAPDDFEYSQKMFDSVLESAEIFNDWHWNFEEKESMENIFADWKWNLEVKVDLKVKFYDDPEINAEWNEFNFWKEKHLSNNVKIDLDAGFLGDSEDEEPWTNCKFWQNSNDNENILQSLVDDVIEEDAGKDLSNFWDENLENQSILESLISDEDDIVSDVENNEGNVEFIWEEKAVALSLIGVDTEGKEINEANQMSFLWNDSDTITALLKTEDEYNVKPSINQELFPWENADHMRKLFELDDQRDLITFSDDETKVKVDSQTKNKEKSGDWLNWPFWNNFGTVKEIIKANEEAYSFQMQRTLEINIQKVFWDISLEDGPNASENKSNNQTPKDPVNIFKIYKHLFSTPVECKDKKPKKKVEEEANLFDDMEDVYADWASIALSDKRSEMKRQTRGREKNRNVGAPSKGVGLRNGLGHRRPGTPTIQTVSKSSSNKHSDFEQCWIETKVPKKERKTAHVWKNAKTQKRLNSKIYAKQPRSIA